MNGNGLDKPLGPLLFSLTGDRKENPTFRIEPAYFLKKR